MKFLLLAFFALQASLQLANAQANSYKTACRWNPSVTSFSNFDVNSCSFVYVGEFNPSYYTSIYRPDASALLNYTKTYPNQTQTFASITNTRIAFGSKKTLFGTIARDAARTTAFINDCIEIVNTGFDGIDLVYGDPFFPLVEDKDVFTAFANSLKTALSAIQKKLTITVSGKASTFGSYNISNLCAVPDFINFVPFDQADSFPTIEPIFGITKLNTTLNTWLTAGCVANKMMIYIDALAYYFIVSDQNTYGFGTPADFSSVSSYRESCNWINVFTPFVVDRITSDNTTLYHNFITVMAREEPATVTAKMNLIISRGLAGAVIDQGEDDNDGLCGGGVFPLTRAAANGLKVRRFKCTTAGSFQHLFDCKKYYTCTAESPIATEVSCSDGQAFDSATSTCVLKENIPGCV